MTVKVLIAHARGDEEHAERLAAPIREAGYEVAHAGTVLVGESVVEEASRLLAERAPVVVCGTVRAMGTKWARTVVNAARGHAGVRVFVVQMEEEADTDSLSFDERIARHWEDPDRATAGVVAALQKYHPLDPAGRRAVRQNDVEARYRQLALDTFDIVDLANLPEDDRHLATRELELRRLYVALRLRLDVPRSSEGDESVFAAMESRRRNGSKGVQLPEDVPAGGLFSVGARLGASRRLVILGDPGAGKTTLLRWLATAYLLRLAQDPDWSALPDVSDLPKEDWLPILIRCRDLPPGARTLDEMLQHSLRRTELPTADCQEIAALLRERIASGSALLLVDGLDEISDAQSRSDFVRQLEHIHTAMPDAPIVVTSRIVGYREVAHRIRSGFEHLTISELTREDKDDFARRWCDLTETPDRRTRATEELIHDIHSSDRIERLTGNPMLLTTMALIKRKIGRLPQRRVELYEKAVEVLLNWRSEVDAPIDRREALPQLEYLAFAMCDAGTQQLREDEVLELLRRVRSEYPNLHMLQAHSPEELLSLLERQTALIVETGRVRHNGTMVPVFEFRHLTLQEYLAGLALVQGHFPGRDRTKSLAEIIGPLAGRVETAEVDDIQEVDVTEGWREPLRLCIASCNDDDVDPALVAILTPSASETNTQRARAVMAASCLADEPNVSRTTAQRVIDALVRSVSHGDGSGGARSSLDRAAFALNQGAWAASLHHTLLEQYLAAEPIGPIETGGLLASVSELEPEDWQRWQDERVQELDAEDEATVVSSALRIMHCAYRRFVKAAASVSSPFDASRLAKHLVERSHGRPPLRQASLWALFWLRRNGWEPSAEQVARLVDHLGASDIDRYSVRFLCSALERTSVGVIPREGFRLLRDPEVGLAVAALMARWGQSADVVRELAPDLEVEPHRLWAARLIRRAGGDAAAELLAPYLRHSSWEVRCEALAAQVHQLEKDDACLLSLNLDGLDPFLDPAEPISSTHITNASAQLHVDEDEVRRRLAVLAQRFGLTVIS